MKPVRSAEGGQDVLISQPFGVPLSEMASLSSPGKRSRGHREEAGTNLMLPPLKKRIKE